MQWLLIMQIYFASSDFNWNHPMVLQKNEAGLFSESSILHVEYKFLECKFPWTPHLLLGMYQVSHIERKEWAN